MKQKRLLFSLIGLCLFLGLSSCSGDDKRVFGDDFDIPNLTDANTIQFTVHAIGEGKLLKVIAGGGRMAIDWGDGRLQKIGNAGANLVMHYKYGNSNTYRVKIWAEELNFFSVFSKMPPVSELHLGYLPKMKDLKLNSFLATPELDLSISCPNVESINIGNLPDLERVDLSQCLKLKDVEIYTNPKLTLIKWRQLLYLNSLKCVSNDALTSLSLKGATYLSDVQCESNPNLSMIETDEKMRVSSLNVNDCAFQSLDFIRNFPSLTRLACNSNQLTILDVSTNSSLESLNCNDNKHMIRLKIPEQNWRNQVIQILDCRFCNLDKDELNSIFTTLAFVPIWNPGYSKDHTIAFEGNPGELFCDKKILEDKGWNIK